MLTWVCLAGRLHWSRKIALADEPEVLVDESQADSNKFDKQTHGRRVQLNRHADLVIIRRSLMGPKVP
jgi:hypothetical protein